jgi:hypothetical protein
MSVFVPRIDPTVAPKGEEVIYWGRHAPHTDSGHGGHWCWIGINAGRNTVTQSGTLAARQQLPCVTHK